MSRSDLVLLAETMMVVSAAWLGLRVAKLQTVHRVLARNAQRHPVELDPETRSRIVTRVQWAVAGVSRRMPHSTCLLQAIAMDALLRRRGLRPQFRVGIRPALRAGSRLEAHAWVECDGEIAIGALEDLATFEPVGIPTPL
jgi:hypothetical protein